jgi:hypothetical protein
VLASKASSMIDDGNSAVGLGMTMRSRSAERSRFFMLLFSLPYTPLNLSHGR